MPWYPQRELAAGKVFTCAVCGKRKYVKYVPKSKLCKRCAAQRRAQKNTVTTISSDIFVTKQVARRLRKKANEDILLSRTEKRNERIVSGIYVLAFVPPIFIASKLFSVFSELWWIFVIAWIIALGLFNTYVIDDKMLSRPRKERMQLLEARVLELAQERKVRIEEQRQFYTSAEWNSIRKLVIREDGRQCASCRKFIRNEQDLTVDHKKSRSKYPELQLNRDNLRVLCRSCNSKKGDREWWEE